MTYDRGKFRRSGCYFTDIKEMFYWKDSYHEGESAQFITSKTNWKCDECDQKFVVGDLISVGGRQFYPDAPIYISGVDRVHYKCYLPEDFNKNPKNVLYCAVTEIDGYGALDNKDKTRWLKWQGMEVNDENLNKGDVAALRGMVFVVIGLFDDKEGIKNLINKNGGGLSASYTKNVTHGLLGKSGKTKYGRKTGKGSKVYKDLKKKKIPILSVDELNEMIKNGKKKKEEIKEEETKKENDDNDNDDNEDDDLTTNNSKEEATKGNRDQGEKKNLRKRKLDDQDEENDNDEDGDENKMKKPARKRRRRSRRK